MTPPEDEANLIAKAISNDVVALEILLSLHRRSLLAHVKSRFPTELRSVLEPDDILQDTFVRAIRGISTFKPAASDPVHNWLITIARNVIADRLKHFRAAKRTGNHVPTDQGGGVDSIVRLLEDLAVYQRTPSKSAASHELMAYIRRAIKRIPTDHGLVLSLRYLSGLDVKETAQKMGRSPQAVVVLSGRALKSLRSELRSISLYI
jgi:RNA polymerase sigma-70 factor (ECF subfamily)